MHEWKTNEERGVATNARIKDEFSTIYEFIRRFVETIKL